MVGFVVIQSSKHRGQDERERYFPSPEYWLQNQPITSSSKNTLACTHAHSQSAALLDTGPDDSEGAVKVADGTPIRLTVTVQQTPEEEKQLRKKRKQEKAGERETYMASLCNGWT
ncbi:hypothetical protein EYF80_052151 [Liparis tanakae]|uniref:Uncharacterized protein n=1 Tax=Liparis tanakae TaxID=230148 RepID=A0A4Z2F9Z4_9TELE|nr:hypothetical protein EYF80_052151 [Liparis tanakae]